MNTKSTLKRQGKEDSRTKSDAKGSVIASFSAEYNSRTHIFNALALRHISSQRDHLIKERGARIAIYANDHIGQQIEANGVYENDEIKSVLSFCTHIDANIYEKSAVDIGANIGNHSIQYAQHFRHIYAFEANPHTYKLLRFNAGFHDNIETFCFGLSNEKNSLKMRENATNYGGSTAVFEGGEGVAEVEITVKIGDDVLLNKEHIGFIKIDVEGMEHAVLQGIKRTIDKHRPIICFEQHIKDFDKVSGKTRSIRFLEDLEYDIFWIEKQHSIRPYLIRRFTNVIDLLFNRKKNKVINIKTGNVPVAFHSALIAVPKVSVSA